MSSEAAVSNAIRKHSHSTLSPTVSDDSSNSIGYIQVINGLRVYTHAMCSTVVKSSLMPNLGSSP